MLFAEDNFVSSEPKFSAMKNILHRVIFTIVLMPLTQLLFALHIIGGEMNYVCLGNNQYQVTVKVFRDCFNGLAPFDNPAYVFVFDAYGNQITYLSLNLPPTDTLNNPGNPCLIIPPGICV